MMRYSVRILSAGSLALLSANAQANVVISSAATQNMHCANGVCAPTAWKAVLNVTDPGQKFGLSDGSLLVADDAGGAVWRVAYKAR